MALANKVFPFDRHGPRDPAALKKLFAIATHGSPAIPLDSGGENVVLSMGEDFFEALCRVLEVLIFEGYPVGKHFALGNRYVSL